MNRLSALLLHHGTPLVWLNVFCEQIGLPIPAVPTLVLAGALARDGHMSSTWVIVGSIVASLIADSVWFLFGRRLGFRVLRTLCRISLSPDSCVRETEARFERWGMPSLLVAKFIPGFSTIAPPMAGASGRSLAVFMVYDGLGAFLWAGSSVAAGHVFHRAVDRVLASLEQLGAWAIVLIACFFALIVAVKWSQRMRFLRKLRFARITPEELLQMLESANPPLVIDARGNAARQRDPRRIPRALVVTTSEIPQRLADLSRDAELILYCT